MSRVSLFISGLGPTPDQNGLVSLASQFTDGRVTKQGLWGLDIPSTVAMLQAYDQRDIVGFSFGGDTAIKLAYACTKAGILIQNLVPLEPVHEDFDGALNWVDWPPDWFMDFNTSAIAAAGTKILCLRKQYGLPPTCAVSDGANYLIPGTSDHANFPRNADVISRTEAAIQ